MINIPVSKLEFDCDYIQHSRCTQVRKLVQIRDKCCQKCGITTSLEVHHILPLCFGGSNIISNCILLCNTCHNFAPDHPVLFIRYIKKSNPIVTHNIPTFLRLYTSHLITNFSCFSPNDISENVDNYIKTNIISRDYNKLFWYRNSKNIWDKDNLDDLFNFQKVTNFLFLDEVKSININRKDFLSSDDKSREKIILNIIKIYYPISTRGIARILNINPKTVKKYLK